MLYEIINLSDPYTFRADSVAVARFVVIALGTGQYDGEDEDGKSIDAMMLTFTEEQEEQAKTKLREFFGDPKVFVNEHRTEIIEALESVMSFERGERGAYDEAIKLIPADKIARYRKKVHRKNLTSLNDIGDRAWKYAKKLHAGNTQPPRAPRQVFVKRGGSA